jgi:hypothetical protein
MKPGLSLKSEEIRVSGQTERTTAVEVGRLSLIAFLAVRM